MERTHMRVTVGMLEGKKIDMRRTFDIEKREGEVALMNEQGEPARLRTMRIAKKTKKTLRRIKTMTEKLIGTMVDA